MLACVSRYVYVVFTFPGLWIHLLCRFLLGRMWLALNSPCLPGFVCSKNIHLKPASTVRIIDFKSPLWGWQWAWDMCRVVCSGQKIPTRCCSAHAAVELLIKALADGMFGYILKAACLPLYYACLCSCARCCQRCVWAMLVWLNAYTRFFTTYSSTELTVGMYFSHGWGRWRGRGTCRCFVTLKLKTITK